MGKFKESIKYKYKKTRLEYLILTVFLISVAYLVIISNQTISPIYIIILPGIMNMIIIHYHYKNN